MSFNLGIPVNSTTTPAAQQSLRDLFTEHTNGELDDSLRVKISEEGQFRFSAGRTFKLMGWTERKQLNQLLTQAGLKPLSLFSQRPTVRQLCLAVPTQIGEIHFPHKGSSEALASELINQIDTAVSSGKATQNSRIGLTEDNQIMLYNQQAKVPGAQAKCLHQLVAASLPDQVLPKSQALTQVGTLLSCLQEIAPRLYAQEIAATHEANHKSALPGYTTLEPKTETPYYATPKKSSPLQTPNRTFLAMEEPYYARPQKLVQGKTGALKQLTAGSPVGSPKPKPAVMPKPKRELSQIKPTPNSLSRIEKLKIKMNLQ